MTCGDKNLICIENGKGGKIEFDIVLPTKKGAIYACHFVHLSEVTTASTDIRKKVSVNVLHCLLGHQNEDSIQKTAQELGWVLMHGSMKACKHCANAKAKQKYV